MACGLPENMVEEPPDVVANEARFDFVEDRDVHRFHQQRKVKPFPGA